MAVALMAKSVLRAVAGTHWVALFIFMELLFLGFGIGFTGSIARVRVFHVGVPLHVLFEFALVLLLFVGESLADLLVQWGKRREPGLGGLDRDLLARGRLPRLDTPFRLPGARRVEPRAVLCHCRVEVVVVAVWWASSSLASRVSWRWVARLRGLRGLSISPEGAERPQERRLALVLGFELRGHFKVF